MCNSYSKIKKKIYKSKKIIFANIYFIIFYIAHFAFSNRFIHVNDATIDRSILNISMKILDGVHRCANVRAGSSVSVKIVGHVVNYAGAVKRLGARE